jgi:hypothetical protein
MYCMCQRVDVVYTLFKAPGMLGSATCSTFSEQAACVVSCVSCGGASTLACALVGCALPQSIQLACAALLRVCIGQCVGVLQQPRSIPTVGMLHSRNSSIVIHPHWMAPASCSLKAMALHHDDILLDTLRKRLPLQEPVMTSASHVVGGVHGGRVTNTFSIPFHCYLI